MKPTASKYKYRRTAIDDIESVETESLSYIIVLNFKIELSWYILHCSLNCKELWLERTTTSQSEDFGRKYNVPLLQRFDNLLHGQSSLKYKVVCLCPSHNVVNRKTCAT